jgi:hypothetical protein
MNFKYRALLIIPAFQGAPAHAQATRLLTGASREAARDVATVGIDIGIRDGAPLLEED